MEQKVLFARVGWMRWYHGVCSDDPKPIGGGAFNKSSLGHERFNFLRIGNRAFGYFQPQLQPKNRHRASSIRLEKIKAGFLGDVLEDVLIIFVATNPMRGGQFVVGWYKSATVYRYEQPSSSKLRKGVGYFLETEWKDAVLVPEPKREFPIPSGKGGIGTANICYPLEDDGKKKEYSWLQLATEYALSYNGVNAAQNPEAASDDRLEEEFESDSETRAGYQSNPTIRKAIEEYAMSWAGRRLAKLGLKPKDKHRTESFDYLCQRDGAELFVEVKGTQTDGKCVFLTPNEAKHAQTHPNSALFIVHGIIVKGKRNPKISGGKERLLMPWDIASGKLEARGYTYSLPGIATKESFQNLPMPPRKVELPLYRAFSVEEFEQIKLGFVPKEMEDKWFIYFDESVDELSFHRSWTGFCIYRIALEKRGSLYEVTRAWANRDPDQYGETDMDQDSKVASWLIDTILLHKERPYPSK